MSKLYLQDISAGSRRPGRILAVIIPAVLGLLFCLLNAAGAELLCVSSGCGIYGSLTLGGVSIYLLGAAAFGAIILLALLALRWPGCRRWLLALLVVVLLGDILFLVWQMLYWPCTSCLVVALLLALCLLGALLAFPEFRRPGVKLVLLLWLLAVLPVTVAAGKELFLPPWAAFGPGDAPVSVYFSPTCPACERTVLDILRQSSLRGQVAFFPVAKNEEDLRRLAQLPEVWDEEGLEALFTPLSAGTQAGWALRWRLARNKMALARMGADRVPLVLAPQLLQSPPAPTAYSNPFFGGGDFPLDLLGIPPLEQGCSMSARAEEPCD
jgi:hypothetical protein